MGLGRFCEAYTPKFEARYIFYAGVKKPCPYADRIIKRGLMIRILTVLFLFTIAATGCASTPPGDSPTKYIATETGYYSQQPTQEEMQADLNREFQKPEVKKYQIWFDLNAGKEGAFFEEIKQKGASAYNQTGGSITPAKAIAEVMKDHPYTADLEKPKEKWGENEYRISCEEGDSEDCSEFAKRYDINANEEPHLLRRLCPTFSAEACTERGNQLLESGNSEKAFAAYKAGCDAKSSESCRRLKNIEKEKQRQAKLEQEKSKLILKCENGSAKSCLAVAKTFPSGSDEEAEYKNRALAPNLGKDKTACENKNNLNACIRASQTMYKINPDDSSWRTYFYKACELGSVDTCLEVRRVAVQNNNFEYTLFANKNLCAANYKDSCSIYQQMLQQQQASAQQQYENNMRRIDQEERRRENELRTYQLQQQEEQRRSQALQQSLQYFQNALAQPTPVKREQTNCRTTPRKNYATGDITYDTTCDSN